MAKAPPARRLGDRVGGGARLGMERRFGLAGSCCLLECVIVVFFKLSGDNQREVRRIPSHLHCVQTHR